MEIGDFYKISFQNFKETYNDSLKWCFNPLVYIILFNNVLKIPRFFLILTFNDFFKKKTLNI